MEFVNAAKAFRFSPKPNSLSRNNDFFSDRLFHTHTNRILIIFVILSTFKRLFSNPITCWVPADLKRYEKYMNRYCWIRGTYYVNQSYDLNMLSIEARDESLLHYYQWVYFFLIIQAFLFYMPRMLWCFITNKILDYDLYNMVDAAVKHDLYSNDTNIIIKYLSANFDHQFNYLPLKNFERFVYVQNKINPNFSSNNGSINQIIPTYFDKFAWQFKKTFLTLIYISIKMLYLLVSLFQIHAMNSILSIKNYSFYGKKTNNYFYNALGSYFLIDHLKLHL
jgi:hypothetical protein